MPFNLFLNLVDRADKLSYIQRTISVLVILSVMTFAAWGFSTHDFDRFYNAVQPHNQTYTELAFDNVYNLPSKISSDNQVKFAFMIHNVEGKTVSYPYVITLQTSDVNKIIKTGSITVTSNNTISTVENLSIQTANKRQQVSITLPDQKQSINLWLKGDR